MRKLATIRKISKIFPIPNSDKIEVALVDGWEVIISKEYKFKVGDKVVYVEIDSKMPELPEYDFLKSRKYIVKTIKMRGQISQGLVLPMSTLPNGAYVEGQDVTKILGITKYDPQLEEEKKIAECLNLENHNLVIKFLMRYKWFKDRYIKKNDNKFPAWIKKTDEERIQNNPILFEKLKMEDIPLTVTEKVDGCSATYFLKKIGTRKFSKKPEYEFGVCSRNQKLQPSKNYYWEIAIKYNIKKALEELIGDNDHIILQGEITGKKIQGNKYNENDYSFWAFNLIVDGKKYDTMEMQNILIKHGIFAVPIAELNFKVYGEISDLVEYVKGKSQIVDREREGCVFRNVEKNISFKCINPDFLLKNDL